MNTFNQRSNEPSDAIKQTALDSCNALKNLLYAKINEGTIPSIGYVCDALYVLALEKDESLAQNCQTKKYDFINNEKLYDPKVDIAFQGGYVLTKNKLRQNLADYVNEMFDFSDFMNDFNPVYLFERGLNNGIFKVNNPNAPLNGPTQQ
jgi:hypothetical protein